MKARFIALYLPQFHPIPENDEWWGRGFTEWTNVAKAKPLFKGHVQPRIPADLGFYDLRLPEVRQHQVELAKEAGIEGFCYYHYWFGNGKQLLEKPFKDVVKSGQPDFPFCLCWANHSWGGGTWTNASRKTEKILFVEQKYLGKEDNEKHFYSLLDAFKDNRYITVDDKPLFMIYDPFNFVGIEDFIKQWRELASRNGLNGIYFVGIVNSTNFNDFRKAGFLKKKNDNDVAARIKQTLNMGFDAVNTNGQLKAEIYAQGFVRTSIYPLLKKIFGINLTHTIDQVKINKYMYTEYDKHDNVYPTIMPNWDRTPRTRINAIYTNSTPEVFKRCIKNVLKMIQNKPEEHRIVVIKSWNEWGEGNYMEPDMQYGHGYINALRDCLEDK